MPLTLELYWSVQSLTDRGPCFVGSEGGAAVEVALSCGMGQEKGWRSLGTARAKPRGTDPCLCSVLCGPSPRWKQREGQGWESTQYVVGKAIGTPDLPHQQVSLRCVLGRQFKTGSRRGSDSREQKVFWLLCLAYAPARGDEKPGGWTEGGCSDLKQEFKKRQEGRRGGFGGKSVDWVKVCVLVKANRGEVVITFGAFLLVQGSLWNWLHSCAANFYNASLSHAIHCAFLPPMFSDWCDWVEELSILFKHVSCSCHRQKPPEQGSLKPEGKLEKLKSI